MKKNILVIGPLPPPLHGMSKNLKNFVDLASKNFCVSIINTSPGNLDKNLRYHFKKVCKFLFGIIKSIYILTTRKVEYVYMPPDGGIGSYYSLVYYLIFKIFSKKVILHHRSFAYINDVRRPYHYMTRIDMENTLHVFLCNCMKERFSNRYSKKLKGITLSNLHYVEEVTHENSISEDLKIGFLSNVSFSKGIGYFLDIHKHVHNINKNIKFIVAGPFEDDKTKDFVMNYINSNECIEYIGPQYNVDKINFYKNIDVFVFPTAYRNEASPNVLFEAVSYSNIVISTDIGCIAEDMKGLCSHIFELDDFFVEKSARQILFYQENKYLMEEDISSGMEVLSDRRIAANKEFIDFKKALQL